MALEPIRSRRLVSSLAPRLAGADAGRRRGSTSLTPGGPVWIRGDAGALERVVMNLVANAADAVAAGGGHVRVAVTRAGASSGGAGPVRGERRD